MAYDESVANGIEELEDLDVELPEGFDDIDEDEETDLESLVTEGTEDEDQPEEEETQEEEQEPQGTSGKRSEPGYVRKRVDEAVAKAEAETEKRTRASMQAEFEQTFEERLNQRMAPIIERLVEMDAQDLLRQGTVKDIETARELARYRQGASPAPASAAGKEPQRNEKGQFTSAQSDDDPATTARISMLKHQANAIQARGGPDVIAEFQNNPRVKQKVISGEMDFYDVAESLKAPKKRPPAPMRSPNGATNAVDMNPILEMSDKEFEKLERRVQNGARIRMKE